MKSFLLFSLVLFFVVSSTGNAEEYIGGVRIPDDFERYFEIHEVTDNDGKKAKVYVDILSPKKDGNEVYYWKVLDYEEPKIVEGFSVLSMKAFAISDCMKTATKHPQFLFHSGNMGEGKMVHKINTEEEWIYYPPKSQGAMVIEFACEAGGIIPNNNGR